MLTYVIVVNDNGELKTVTQAEIDACYVPDTPIEIILNEVLDAQTKKEGVVGDKAKPNTVTVDADALAQILSAINGPSYLVRELQAIRSLGDSPIDLLIKQYNEQMNTSGKETE